MIPRDKTVVVSVGAVNSQRKIKSSDQLFMEDTIKSLLDGKN